MKGISFITNEKDQKIAVQISYEVYGDYLDDIIDGLIAESRKNDEKISFEEFTKELKEEGLIDQ